MKTYTPAQKQQILARARRLVKWDESEHPRDSDGKFGAGGGSGDAEGGGTKEPSSNAATSSIKGLKPHLSKLMNLAQSLYDDWEQEGPGEGICYAVASEFADVLNEHGISAYRTSDEDHSWVVANFKEGVHSIDIPPGVYEDLTIDGWAKIPDVKITAADIEVTKVGEPMSASAFDKKYRPKG